MAASRTMAGLTVALAAALSGFLIGPASACEPIHSISRTPGFNPEPVPDMICWAGPCQNGIGVVDDLGRFFVDKDLNGVIDHVIMNVDNGSLHQVLVSSSTGAICSPPAGTVSGCRERYRVKTAKACPLGQAPCRARDKQPINLKNLDEVNAVMSGGSITLSDGQVVTGVKSPGYWLYFNICCPDAGQFGAIGTTISTTTSYQTRVGSDVGTCTLHQSRLAPPDVIPTQTFPCP
jgi:hypothetical protein